MYPRDKFTRSAPDGPRRNTRSLMTMAATLSIAAMALAGCSSINGAAASSSVINTEISAETASFFNSDKVHEISVEADEDELQSLLEAYESDQSKEWISVNVTIDGQTFKNVGLRLKGNSTLRQADTSSDPQDLPWQIRLDKFVDGQSYAGRSQFVIRTNTSETSLNEAVALALLGEAGLATEHAAATRFTLNGSDAQLRLVIDNPSDEYYSSEMFSGEGITYKADSTGDYSYRGENGSDYATAFSVEAGADDLTPIAEFLDFVNNSSDEDFAAQLSEHLDVDQFATYLAMQDLVSNSDDIDGPGNNSFLRYDTASGTMTVVAWDQNLSYGGMGGGGMGAGGFGGQGGAPGGDNAGGGRGFDTDSMLERFLPDDADLDAAKTLIAKGELPEGAALPEGTTLADGTTLLDVLKQLAEGEMPTGLNIQGMMGQGPAQGGDMPQMPEGQAPGADAGTGTPDTQADGTTQEEGTTDANTGTEAQGGRMGGGSKSNALVTRFLANEDFKAQYEQAKTDLTAKLYDSGTAQKILDTWSALLTSEAGDMVDADTVSTEAAKISAFFTADSTSGADQSTGQVPGQAPGRGTKEEESTEGSASPSTPEQS
ncbi:CotH kinase family protein [Glutamicibacter sp. NPDC087344]|uniref:CotH kinase family protein n=1 Tax=Glutamicibacter sp. NPDC087344 TaxID=3363994 RepID=UPI0038243DD8